MKFDVIIGNPPYQAPEKNGTTKKGGSSNTIWPKFVTKSMEYLNDGGYLALIHPTRWRSTNQELWTLLTSKQIEYLEIHNEPGTGGRETSKDVFGVATSFDYYILHNTAYNHPTEINDAHGKTYIIDLRQWPWLPNAEFDFIKNLIAKSASEQFDSIWKNNNYGTNQPFVSKQKTKKHKYPVINSITESKGIQCFWSSKNDKGQYGIPKIIFTNGRYIKTILDIDGKYAMTEMGRAITISSKAEAKLIAKALDSKLFASKFLQSTKWSNAYFSTDAINSFKKNWYKIVLEEEEKLKNAK